MPSLSNPILPGFYPDPSVIRVEDTYYMVNSTFVYFPCITISASKDLQNWETVGHAVTDHSYIDMSEFDAGRGFWAPDISYSSATGRYYITATLYGNGEYPGNCRQMIVWSDRPEGPYSEPVYINEPGIDPSLFHDDDGRHYLIMNPQVKIIPLTDDCLAPAGAARMLYEGWNKRKTEGPHLVKKDGYYYLFMAEGGTGDGHMITVARAKRLEDEFEPCPHNPLLTQTDPGAELQRTGHGCPFMTKEGDWMIVYLCSRKRGGRYSLLGRETAIASLTWDSEGWPVINGGRGALTTVELPSDYPVPASPVTSVILRPGEYVNGLPGDFLFAEGYALLRQRFIDNITSLTVAPELIKTQEIGLIFYYDRNCYVKFGISPAARHLELSVRVFNREKKDEEMTIGIENIYRIPSELKLIVRTRGISKEFLYEKDGFETMVCLLKDCSILTDEGRTMGKRFTGPAYGMMGYFDSGLAFKELSHVSL